MNKFGIIIKKLVLQGPGKEDAILTLNKGLNVVAGASDTGKSFAYECINYILGGTDVPEKPKESIGYDIVLLEFIDKKSGQDITLKRSLDENKKTKIYYYISDIYHISTVSEEILSSDSKAKNSLSSKLMSLCDCSYEYILKSTSKGETEAFTFRKFVSLTMLNDSRIAQRNSPIFLGDTKRDSNSPKEIAVFFTILSGIDYKKHDKSESIEVKKAQLRGRIEELSFLCNELKIKVVQMEKSVADSNVENVNDKLTEMELVIKEYKLQIEIHEKNHKLVLDEYRLLEIEKSRIKDNLSKFRLLKKNYESDIERLDFIDQSHNYIDQLVNIKCPVCSSSMDNNEDNDRTKEIYFIAIDKEKQKLKAHLSDLDDTILDFDNDLLEYVGVIQSKQKDIELLERLLSEQSTFISSKISDYEKYLEIRDDIKEIQKSRDKLTDMTNRIVELTDRINNTKSDTNKFEIKKLSDDLMTEFCDIIKIFLGNWGLIDNKDEVVFNKKTNDVIVAEKTKASYGKGARAIINSAFILSIMEYCFSRGLPHPGFVILDSPLTTYKERDKEQKWKNEEVNHSIKESFFKKLAASSSDCQIIIFDNEIPPKDAEAITYHHFTGNKELERTGFIPN
ncbi:hypothetical protein [Paenibacillus etheri]|uniref:Rad50/SbcC-type AAA domain-containing protein n=1 Tax=Paenibacillus etheri TaxID=1306852 RepID=A0A0W1AWD5_9BACL|nr:hypothetical protein [Paenibacillus etheri]KTD85681.1 hypothetical protein UQ64_19510 [Paenibacillus etheri]